MSQEPAQSAASRIPGRRIRRLLLCAVVLCATPDIAGAAEALPVLGGSPAGGSDRFSFVVHGDLTGGERDGIFAVAAQQMSLLQPAFVISVGDLIEGDGQTEEALMAEWRAYERRAATIAGPVYLVGGNHDLTSTMQREVWRERYGPTYYHFRFGGALFLVLDTEDYSPPRRAEITAARNEATAIADREGWDAFAKTDYASMPERTSGTVGPAQRDYFLDVIENNPDVRWTFLFMHKAPWEGEAGGGFAELERALKDRPYTVFHGHEHAQAHLQRHGRDYIRLATTGGVQLAAKGRSVDHITLVTVGDRVSIATLDLEGIRTPAGSLPGPGAAAPCFDTSRCSER